MTNHHQWTFKLGGNAVAVLSSRWFPQTLLQALAQARSIDVDRRLRQRYAFA
jgi:hypothetical protein